MKSCLYSNHKSFQLEIKTNWKPLSWSQSRPSFVKIIDLWYHPKLIIKRIRCPFTNLTQNVIGKWINCLKELQARRDLMIWSGLVNKWFCESKEIWRDAKFNFKLCKKIRENIFRYKRLLYFYDNFQNVLAEVLVRIGMVTWNHAKLIKAT